jgi:hypothetical protein
MILVAPVIVIFIIVVAVVIFTFVLTFSTRCISIIIIIIIIIIVVVVVISYSISSLRSYNVALSDKFLYVTYNTGFPLGGPDVLGSLGHPVLHTGRMTDGLLCLRYVFTCFDAWRQDQTLDTVSGAKLFVLWTVKLCTFSMLEGIVTSFNRFLERRRHHHHHHHHHHLYRDIGIYQSTRCHIQSRSCGTLW